jgi:hypothetical protein
MEVSPGLVAVVLGEKSGFPSARLVDTGMSVVSVLTGQHSFWGGVKLKSPMESTDISVRFADRIKKLIISEKASGIRRTRAGLDLNCRPYGGSCRTRTNTCRPALHEPPGTSAVVVRHWPVLGHSPRPEGRQDRVPDRHILRHCYMCRS